MSKEAMKPAAPAESVAVPAGYALVPVEPTEAMCKAAVVFANGNAVYKNVAADALKIEEAIYGEAWAAMLAAAPPAPAAAAPAEPVRQPAELPLEYDECTWGRCRSHGCDGGCIKPAAPAEPVALACGHHASLAVLSAESGDTLYCELCDDKAGRRDAELREQELQAELTTLRAALAEPAAPAEPVRQPLTERAAIDLMPTTIPADYDADLLWYCRAIERAHGITAKAEGGE